MSATLQLPTCLLSVSVESVRTCHEMRKLDIMGLLSATESQGLMYCSWWKRWIAHVGMVEEDGRLKTLEDSASAGDAPGPIMNDELLKADDHHTDLIEGLREGEHFKILSEGSWKYLSDLYGEPASYASLNALNELMVQCLFYFAYLIRFTQVITG